MPENGFYGFPCAQQERARDFRASGKPGATAGADLAGGTTAGAPTSGRHDLGEVIVDQTAGTLWICTAAGVPGTWTQVVGGSGSYTLPAATASTIGGVKPGVGLRVEADGTLEGGAATPPARLWRQAISPGAPTTVQTAGVMSDGAYNTFPGLAVNRSGALLTVYREGTAHLSVNGKITTQTSTDGGATWSAKTYIASPSSGHDYRDPSVVCTLTGRLIVNFFDNPGATSTACVLYTMSSDDNGSTWSAPAAHTPFSSQTATSGAILQQASGALLLPCYGQNSGDSTWRTGIIRSLDNGATWSALITITAANSGTTEAGLVELPDHSVVIYIRNASPGPLQTSSSTDAGVSWSTPAAMGFSVQPGRPTPVLLPVSQELFLFAGDATNNYVTYWYSLDLGTTWSAGTSLNAQTSEYQWAVPLGHNILGVIYSGEVSSSRADLHFLTLAAGVPAVTGVRSGNAALASLLSGLAQQGEIIDGTTAGTAAALDATTTEGDLLYRHSGALARLGVGVSGQALVCDGTDPLWGQPLPSSPLVILPNPYAFVDDSAADNGQPPDMVLTAAGDIIGVGGM